MDNKTCAQCGKRGTGYYEVPNAHDKYICQKCVLENIKHKSKPQKL